MELKLLPTNPSSGITDNKTDQQSQQITPSCPPIEDVTDLSDYSDITDTPTRPIIIITEDTGCQEEVFPAQERMTVTVVADVYCNRAIPSNHRDQDYSADESDQFGNDRATRVIEVSSDDSESNDNGSTETIPSNWIPTPSMPTAVRSQSLEMLPRRDNSTSSYIHMLARSSSDPTIAARRRLSSGGESYSHRHVRLSLRRSESQSINIGACCILACL